MNAKEYLLNINPLLAEAVDNGYDIRLDEEEILEAMETYHNHKVNSVSDEEIENANKGFNLSKPFLKGFIVGSYWLKQRLLKK